MRIATALLTTAVLLGAAPATSEPAPEAYHWQQGQWFAYPIDYRSPPVPAESVDIATSREATARTLALYPGRTGFAAGGRYDPEMLTGTEAQLGFAFRLDDLNPIEHELRYTPDYTTGGAVVAAAMEWAGPSAPDPDVIRKFSVLNERIGLPAALGMGRLQPYHDLPLQGDPTAANHRIYEAADHVVTLLRCTVLDTNGDPGLQPLCDGEVWDRATNIILYLTFPAEIAMTPGGWLAPAEKALQLATSWRLDD